MKKQLMYIILSLACTASFQSYGMIEITSQQNKGDGKDFIKAAKQGNIFELKRQLLENPDLVNTRKGGKPFGKTPLLYAVKKGNFEVVSLLLKAGANPNAESKNGKGEVITPLARAEKSMNNEDEMIDLLIKFGAVPDEKLEKALREENPCIKKFVKACQENDRETMHAIVTQDNFDSNMKDHAGKTLLTRAVLCKNPYAVQLLTQQRNIQLDAAPEKTKKTALMRAIVLGDVESVRILVEAGAKTDLKDYKGKDACSITEKQIKDFKKNESMQKPYLEILEILKSNTISQSTL